MRDDVPEPAKGPLEDCFGADGLPDVRRIQEHFVREGRLKKEDALRLVRMAEDILSGEPNMLELAPPMTIAGDLHGQCVSSFPRFFFLPGCSAGSTTCCSCSRWRGIQVR